MRRTLYLVLALAIAAPLAATAWAGVRPAAGLFATKNERPPASIIVQTDRKHALFSAGCPANPNKQKYQMQGVTVKIRHGKIKFDGKTKVFDTRAGKSVGKIRVTFHAVFKTKNKAVGAYHIYRKGCSKLDFTVRRQTGAG